MPGKYPLNSTKPDAASKDTIMCDSSVFVELTSHVSRKLVSEFIVCSSLSRGTSSPPAYNVTKGIGVSRFTLQNCYMNDIETWIYMQLLKKTSCRKHRQQNIFYQLHLLKFYWNLSFSSMRMRSVGIHSCSCYLYLTPVGSDAYIVAGWTCYYLPPLRGGILCTLNFNTVYCFLQPDRW